MFTYFTAGLALVASAYAYTQPTTGPEGNPIYTPGLDEIVPAGQPYSVTWNATTDGTVTLLLLKGPSSNAVAQYAIAEKIPNSGSYTWNVASDLGSASTDGTGYGIQLIADSNGQYQYSTQFGIKNSGDVSSSSSSSSSSESTASATATASWSEHGPHRPTESDAWSTSCSTDSATWTTSTTASTATSEAAALPTTSAYYPSSNGTTSATKPAGSSGALPSSTGKPVPTNAAGAISASFGGLVIAAGVAIMAL